MAGRLYSGAHVNLMHAEDVHVKARHSGIDPETLYLEFGTGAGNFEVVVIAPVDVQRRLYSALGAALAEQAEAGGGS